MPLRDVTGSEDVGNKFQEQLEKCGVDFFDYYLLHNVGRHVWKKIHDFGIVEFAARQKEEGKIRYLGLSFHDTADFLEKVMEEYSKYFDFVQLQINYLDDVTDMYENEGWKKQLWLGAPPK